MQDITIKEPIKIRLKGYKTLYRRVLNLENYEKAILGLIHMNNGEYDFNELGILLGFAMEENIDKNVRKDIAEIELYQSYLDNLKSNHLIQYNENSIELTFWGEKAFADQVKYQFCSGQIQIPSFFDIELSEENSIFQFKELGIEVSLTNEKFEKSAWDIESLQKPNEFIVNQLELNRSNSIDTIYFDSIEPNSDYDSVETILDISQNENTLLIYYDGVFNEKLTTEINKESNISKATALRLKIKFTNLLESNKQFEISDLVEFETLIDWNDILKNQDLTWNSLSIESLNKLGVNWQTISSLCPIGIIIQSLGQFKEYFNWDELTKRFKVSFILLNINNYPWDVDILIDKITLDEFKDNFSSIVKLEGIDLYKFYDEIGQSFIADNFKVLPGIEDFITAHKPEFLTEYLLKFSQSNWNKNLVSQKLVLGDLEANFVAFIPILNFEVIVKRLITYYDKFNDEIFEDVLNRASYSDDESLLNAYTNCNLSLNKLKKLNNKGLIYWGDEAAPGFEKNNKQKWSVDILNTFKEKWNYKDVIKHLGYYISDSEALMTVEIEWDYDSISENKALLNQEGFLGQFKDKILIEKAILVLEKQSLLFNLDIIQKINSLEQIEVLPTAISNHFSLEEIFANYIDYYSIFVKNFDKINWVQVWSKTSEKFIKENIELVIGFVDLTPASEILKPEITSLFTIKEILDRTDLAWDWNMVTEQAFENENLDKNSIEDYAAFWAWDILIQKYFHIEDLRLESGLSDIAYLISLGTEVVSKNAWKLITKEYPKHLIWNAIHVTNEIDIFKWDWDYLSSTNKLELDISTLTKYKNKINWTLLSNNSYLNSFFRYDKQLYSTKNEWERNVYSYLIEFNELWDFKEMSNLKNITFSETLISYFKAKWDWDIISSEKSRLLTNKRAKGIVFDEKLIKRFEKYINFSVISARTDASLDFDLIKRFEDKNWDWSILSCNNNLIIKKETLLKEELIDKPWNWKLLSVNPNIKFTNEDLVLLKDKDLDWQHFSSQDWLINSTLNELSEKYWNWQSISKSNFLIFDENLLQIFIKREEINWQNVLESNNLHCNSKTIAIIAPKLNTELWSILSYNENLSFENNNLLEIYKELWDWEALLYNYKIELNSLELLKKYQEFINFDILSNCHHFKPDLSILREFKSVLNWSAISDKISMDIDTINEFKSYIDWNEFCINSDFDGSLTTVKKFIEFIDINAIEENKSLDNETKLYLQDYLKKNMNKRFVYDLKKQYNSWAGNAYHFTNIDNAVKILRDKKIKCRNDANQLSDSAGNVVWSNTRPHNYSRFYFRPHTQTQFYNEFLGIDIDNGYDKNGTRHSFYENEYANLDFPKCPIPIYFVFPLKSVLENNTVMVSNGNMQRKATKFGYLEEMYSRFNFKDLFLNAETSIYNKEEWVKYKNYAQQELLIEKQFDFSELNNFQIVCKSMEHKKLLINLLGSKSVEFIKRIKIQESIFKNKNPECIFVNESHNFKFSSNKKATGYFEIKYSDLEGLSILESDAISKSSNRLIFNSHLELKIINSSLKFEIYYIDEIKQKWFVYSNSLLEENQTNSIRHFKKTKPLNLTKDVLFSKKLWQ